MSWHLSVSKYEIKINGRSQLRFLPFELLHIVVTGFILKVHNAAIYLQPHSAQAIAYYIKYLAPSHKVKAVDLLDSKLNEVCETEISCV